MPTLAPGLGFRALAAEEVEVGSRSQMQPRVRPAIDSLSIPF